jgi:hypothetical protein
MPDITEVADQIAGAGSWDERVSLIRTIPQEFGEAHRQTVYDRVAQRAYVSSWHLTSHTSTDETTTSWLRLGTPTSLPMPAPQGSPRSGRPRCATSWSTMARPCGRFA